MVPSVSSVRQALMLFHRDNRHDRPKILHKLQPGWREREGARPWPGTPMHSLRLEKTGTRDPAAEQHMQQLHLWRGGSGPQQMFPAGICAQKQVRLYKIIQLDPDNCLITVVLTHSHCSFVVMVPVCLVFQSQGEDGHLPSTCGWHLHQPTRSQQRPERVQNHRAGLYQWDRLLSEEPELFAFRN